MRTVTSTNCRLRSVLPTPLLVVHLEIILTFECLRIISSPSLSCNDPFIWSISSRSPFVQGHQGHQWAAIPVLIEWTALYPTLAWVLKYSPLNPKFTAVTRHLPLAVLVAVTNSACVLLARLRCTEVIVSITPWLKPTLKNHGVGG